MNAEEVNYNGNEYDKERELFSNVILANLDSQLEGGKLYLTGYDYTIADIAYFNSLTTVLAVLEETIDS